MGLTDKIIGAVLVGLFVFALLTFGYNAQVENNTNGTILDNEHFAGLNDSFSTTLGNVDDNTKQQLGNFQNATPVAGSDEGFGILTIPATATSFVSMMFGSFNLVSGLLEDVIGVPAIVFNLLGGVLVVIVLFLSWRMIKVGGT